MSSLASYIPFDVLANGPYLEEDIMELAHIGYWQSSDVPIPDDMPAGDIVEED